MNEVRSFIAIELDPRLLPGVLEVQKQILSTGADMKAVEPENIHFTLKFLGEISQSKVNEVADRMNTLSFRPFRTNIAGVGCFPNIRSPRVVWIGVSTGSDEFLQIAGQLDRSLVEAGFKPEGERFTPHLTIGRIRSGRNKAALMKKLGETLNTEIGEMTVDTVKLKKSTLTPKGPIYTTLSEIRAK